MGLLIAKTGSDMMSGNNLNVRADYEGRVRLTSANLFPDPSLNMFDPATSLHRYLNLGFPLAPTHWAPYIRDRNKVKNSARQVLAPISLENSTYDQEDELINGPSPADPDRALPIAAPIEPDARAYKVSDTIGLPEGFYTIAWGYSPDRDWNKPGAALTNPGPRSTPFYLAQGQGFMLPTPTEFAENITALVLWISEPRLVVNAQGELQAVPSTQAARLAPMYAIQKWRVRGLEDFIRVVGPFTKRNGEESELPERKNLTFVGNRKDMPKLRVREENTHHKHEEQIKCQVAYAFQTSSGISEVKTDAGWHRAAAGRRAIVFEPMDYEMRKSNKDTERERKDEIEKTGKIDETKETNLEGEDEETDARGRKKEKEKTDRIRGWRPIVRFKATNDPDDPDDEHGVTEWHMIVEKGGQNAFKEKGDKAVVFASEPGKWPRHAKTELVRVNIHEGDHTGVLAPTEAPEPPEGEMILDLNTSGLTPGKHSIKTSLFVLEEFDELESLTSPETEVDIKANENQGIRVRRPRYHNLADNDDAAETDLEDMNKPLGWDFIKPFPNNVRVWNPKRGGVRIEDNSNVKSTVHYLRTSVSTLRADTNRYTLRFNVDIGRHTNGKLRAVLEQYDRVAGVPQLVGATIIKGWTSRVNDKDFEFHISTNQNDPNNKNRVRLHPNTKEIRVRFEGEGNDNVGSRNMDVEISKYGVFQGWARPRKSKRLDVRRGETPEPKDTVYPHGGYCMVVENPVDSNPYKENFVRYLYESFENATHFTNNWSESSLGATAGGRHADWALHEDRGYRTAKTTQGGNAHMFITHNMGGNRTQGAVSADFFVQTLNNAGAVDMLFLRQPDGTPIARLGVNSANRFQLKVNRVGAVETFTDTKALDAGDLGRMELVVDGLGGVLGRVRAYAMIGEGERRKLFEITGLNFTGMSLRSVRVGCEDSNNNALWDIYWDDVYVTDTALTNVTYEPGNHIEYYGPNKTPKTSTYGPYGVRVPVKAGETYTFGFNVKTEDVTGNTRVGRWRARSADHRILETFDFVSPGLAGDTPWTRYTQTFTVPLGTAYVEWFENDIGAGLVLVHGIQLEKGAVATPYTNKNELSGNLSVFFVTAAAGLQPRDPMGALAEVTKIRGIEANITESDTTSYFVDYRSGNSLGTLGAYTTDVSSLNRDHKYIEVRVQLSSTSDTESPELSRIEVDLARPHSHLLREDGTEFAGGTLVNAIASEHVISNSERVQFASGAVGDHTWGTVTLRRIPTMTVYAFRPQTAAEITSFYGTGFVRLQTPYGRQTIRIDEAPSFETNAASRLYLDPQRKEYFQVYTATISGIIEAEEVF